MSNYEHLLKLYEKYRMCDELQQCFTNFSQSHTPPDNQTLAFHTATKLTALFSTQ